MKKRLTSDEIKGEIIGKTFLGKHPPHFEYIITINANGLLEGKNNYNHHDWGKWELYEKCDTLTVNWENGWQNSTSELHKIDGIIQMLDATTGKLNTCLSSEIEPVNNIKNYTF